VKDEAIAEPTSAGFRLAADAPAGSIDTVAV